MPSDTRPPHAAAIDAQTFRKVLGHVPTSVAIAAARDAQGPFGIVIGSLVSISLEPPLVGMFIDNGSRSLPRLVAASEISINVLSADQADYCLTFSKDKESRFRCGHWETDGIAAPRLNPALAWVRGALVRADVIGDHHLLVIEPSQLEINPDQADSDPLIFFRGKFAA